MKKFLECFQLPLHSIIFINIPYLFIRLLALSCVRYCFRRVQVRADHRRELEEREGLLEGDEEAPEGVGEPAETSAEGKEPRPEEPMRCNRKNRQK